MADPVNWPRKVFLESTALFQLGSKLQKPEFARLLELKGILNFDLFVSEVSFAEYVRQRKDKVDGVARDVKSVGAWFAENQPQSIAAAQKQVAEFRKEIGDLYAKKAAEAGIQIVQIPGIDIRRLLQMSINRIPPFETSPDDKTEKGFRDSLIMFSILESIKGRPEDFALVVTNDVLMTKGLQIHADEFRTTVEIVSNLDDANKHIEARMNEWYRTYLREESEAAKTELAKYMKEISDQVRTIKELTDADFGIVTFATIGGGSRLLDFGESIERVNSLKMDQIDSAVWRDKDKPESQILFRIHCSAKVVTSVVTATPYSWPSVNKYLVGAGTQEPSFLKFSTLTASPKQERERELPLMLYGEAKLQQSNGEWTLLSIKVDKSQPTSEETAALLSML